MSVRILIVDDDPDILKLMRLWIENAPEDVEVAGVAASGNEAIGLVAELDPDVVLLDARMPGADGFEVGEQILSLRPTQRIVLYSGGVDDKMRERARSAGFAGCVAKSDYAALPAAIVAAAR